ncbi:MAG: DpnD/PcfM family protein [Fusobacteriaceae bacterium]
MKFHVEIEEILQRVVEVEAEDIDEAMDIVRQQYRDEEIVLDAGDFKGEEFREFIPN